MGMRARAPSESALKISVAVINANYKSVLELKRELERQPAQYEIINLSSLTKAKAFMEQRARGIIICSYHSKKELKELFDLGLLVKTRKEAAHFEVILLQKAKDRNTDLLLKSGVSAAHTIKEDSSAVRKSFKSLSNEIADKWKKSLPAVGNATPAEAKEVYSSLINDLPPLTLPSDIWYSNHKPQAKFGKDQIWIIPLIGPPPNQATWVQLKSNENQKTLTWKLNIVDPSLKEFIPDAGNWLFFGDRPNYLDGVWTFKSVQPQLAFYDANQKKLSHIRVNLNPRRELDFAKNSTASFNYLNQLQLEFSESGEQLNLGNWDSVPEKLANVLPLNANANTNLLNSSAASLPPAAAVESASRSSPPPPAGDALAQSQVLLIDPIDCRSDCWIKYKEPAGKNINGFWLVPLIGPAPRHGKWEKINSYKGQDPQAEAFRFKIRSNAGKNIINAAGVEEFHSYIPEDGYWIFFGRMPEYSKGVWTFTGPKAQLSFYSNLKKSFAFHRFFIEKNTILSFAVNSAHAEKHYQVILSELEGKQNFEGEKKWAPDDAPINADDPIFAAQTNLINFGQEGVLPANQGGADFLDSADNPLPGSGTPDFNLEATAAGHDFNFAIQLEAELGVGAGLGTGGPDNKNAQNKRPALANDFALSPEELNGNEFSIDQSPERGPSLDFDLNMNAELSPELNLSLDPMLDPSLSAPMLSATTGANSKASPKLASSSDPLLPSSPGIPDFEIGGDPALELNLELELEAELSPDPAHDFSLDDPLSPSLSSTTSAQGSRTPAQQKTADFTLSMNDQGQSRSNTSSRNNSTRTTSQADLKLSDEMGSDLSDNLDLNPEEVPGFNLDSNLDFGLDLDSEVAQEDDDSELAQDNYQPSTEEKKSIESHTAQETKMVFMVLEPFPKTIAKIRRVMSLLNHEIVTYPSFETFLPAIKATSPQALIMNLDVNFEKDAAIIAVKAIRNKFGDSLPIFAYSKQVKKEKISEGMENGINDYWKRKFELTDYIQSIEKYLKPTKK